MTQAAFDYREKYEVGLLDNLTATYEELDEARKEVSAMEEVLSALEDCEGYKPVSTVYDDEVYKPLRDAAKQLRGIIKALREDVYEKLERYNAAYRNAYPEDF